MQNHSRPELLTAAVQCSGLTPHNTRYRQMAVGDGDGSLWAFNAL